MTGRFWEKKSLQELSPEEWESLCDRCGRCCLHKLQDEDSGEVFYTRIACRLLDLATCRCREYENRQSLVTDCLVLRPGEKEVLEWLPRSCAYRLLGEGKPLPAWHPLVSGGPEAMRRRGISGCRGAVPEERVTDPESMEDFIIPWPQ